MGHLYRSRIAVIVVANVFMYTAINVFLPCRFETNDDVTMAWIASGAYTGVPEAHLVYINYLYGAFVAFLYRIVPNVEWYTLLFGLIHVCSSSVIVTCLLKDRLNGNLLIRLLCVGAFYLVYFYSVLYLQFTTVAVVCAIASLLLITLTNHWMLGMMWFALASLVRYDAAMMVGLVYVLFYPKLFVKEHTSWKKFATLVGACVLAVVLNVIDNSIYTADTRWREFKSYNESRNIADNPLFRTSKVDDCNIAEINLLHALNFTPDERVVTESQLREASDLIFKRATLKDRYDVAMSQLKEPKYLYALILLFLYSVAVAAMEEKVGLRILSILPFFFVIATMFAIASSSYLKYRVFLGLFLSTFVFTTVFCPLIYYNKWSHFKRLVLYGILSLLILLWGKRELANVRKELTSAPSLRENLAQFKNVAAQYPNTLSFVCLPIEAVNPWKVTEAAFSNRIEEMWWMVKWPLHTQLRGHNDIVSNQIVLCTPLNGWREMGDFFAGAIKYNYGVDTEPQLLFEAGGYAGIILSEK